jgi:hypothetical protein
MARVPGGHKYAREKTTNQVVVHYISDLMLFIPYIVTVIIYIHQHMYITYVHMLLYINDCISEFVVRAVPGYRLI